MSELLSPQILNNLGTLSQQDKAKIINDLTYLEVDFLTDVDTIVESGGNVTSTKKKIVIVTSSLSTAAGASYTITVDTSAANISSLLSVSIGSYSGTIGTDGIPVVMCSNPVGNAIDIVISNVHPINALDGNLVISLIDHADT